MQFSHANSLVVKVGGEAVWPLLAVELVGGKSINVCHILCQKQCNCSPLNQQGVRWAGSDEIPLCCRCLHRPQQGQQAGDHRDDLRPESLVNS